MFSHAAIVLSRHGLRISCFRRQPTVVLQIIYRLQIVAASAQPRAVCNTSCETRFLSRRFLVLQDASEACGWLPRNSSGADPSPARKQFNQESRAATRGFRVLSSEGKGSQLIVGLLGSKKLNRAQPRAAVPHLWEQRFTVCGLSRCASLGLTCAPVGVPRARNPFQNRRNLILISSTAGKSLLLQNMFRPAGFRKIHP